jgi:hypothetical protein
VFVPGDGTVPITPSLAELPHDQGNGAGGTESGGRGEHGSPERGWQLE